MSLHTNFADAVTRIRRAFGRADQGHFYVSVTASGRTETSCDSIKIEYRVGEGSYSSESVTGSSLDACVTEWLRRKGWNEANAPLALTHEVQS